MNTNYPITCALHEYKVPIYYKMHKNTNLVYHILHLKHFIEDQMILMMVMILEKHA